MSQKQASLFLQVMFLCVKKLRFDHLRHHGHGKYVGVGMKYERAREFPVVLEHLDIFESAVPLEIANPLHVELHDKEKLVFRKTRESPGVRPVLHHDLMGTHIAHLIVKPFGSLPLVYFAYENRVSCRKAPDQPFILAVFELFDESGGLAFIAGAEWAFADSAAFGHHVP